MSATKINADLRKLARPIDTLHEDPKNARKHAERDLAIIAKSLATHGQQKPIVATKDGKVIAGNGTLAAARSLGWDKIAVVTYDDEDAAKQAAFAVVDNRSAELSEWDFDALVGTIAGLPVDLRADVGFTERELDGLLLSMRWEGLDDTKVTDLGGKQREVVKTLKVAVKDPTRFEEFKRAFSRLVAEFAGTVEER
jgi:hypothetical protein